MERTLKDATNCSISSHDWTSSAASSVHSDYAPSEGSDSDDSVVEPNNDRRYPERQRIPRVIPGAIPWDAVQL